MNQKITTIIFDFDGTLADTFKARVETWHAALNTHGITFDDNHLQQLIRSGIDNDALLDQLTGGALAPRLKLAVLQQKRDGRKKYLPEVGPFPDVLPVLQLLTAEGFRVGICSGNSREDILTFLDDSSLGQFFGEHNIIGEEDSPYTKPNPHLLLCALCKFKAEPGDVLFVGDADTDRQMAESAGVSWLLLDRESTSSGDEPAHTIRSLSTLFSVIDDQRKSYGFREKMDHATESLRLTEYTKLREEILQYQRFRLRILIFAMGAIGALFTLPLLFEKTSIDRFQFIAQVCTIYLPHLIVIPAIHFTYLLSRSVTFIGTYIMFFHEKPAGQRLWEHAKYDTDQADMTLRLSSRRYYSLFYATAAIVITVYTGALLLSAIDANTGIEQAQKVFYKRVLITFDLVLGAFGCFLSLYKLGTKEHQKTKRRLIQHWKDTGLLS